MGIRAYGHTSAWNRFTCIAAQGSRYGFALSPGGILPASATWGGEDASASTGTEEARRRSRPLAGEHQRRPLRQLPLLPGAPRGHWLLRPPRSRHGRGWPLVVQTLGAQPRDGSSARCVAARLITVRNNAAEAPQGRLRYPP